MIDKDSFSLTTNATIATGTYSANGILQVLDPVGLVKDAIGYVWENTTVANAQDVVKANGSQPIYTQGAGQAFLTTVSTPLSTNPMTDAFQPAMEAKINLQDDQVQFAEIASDSSGSHVYKPRTQVVPQAVWYKVRIRLKAHKHNSYIMGKTRISPSQLRRQQP